MTVLQSEIDALFIGPAEIEHRGETLRVWLNAAPSVETREEVEAYVHQYVPDWQLPAYVEAPRDHDCQFTWDRHQGPNHHDLHVPGLAPRARWRLPMGAHVTEYTDLEMSNDPTYICTVDIFVPDNCTDSDVAMKWQMSTHPNTSSRMLAMRDPNVESYDLFSPS